MARQQGGSTRTEGSEQQSQQQSQSGQSQGAGGTTGTGATRRDAARGDQERQLDVTREGGVGTTGRAAARQERGGRSGAGTSLAGRGGVGLQGQQGSLLPAFMANPGLMASAFMSNPFAFAQAMSQEMDRIFSSFGELGVPEYDQFGGTAGAGRGALTAGGPSRALQRGMQTGAGGLAQWIPPMEVLRRGNELVVRADLPGLSPDDVNIEIDDGMLIVSGERRQENEDREEGIYRSERSYGSFVRTIALPEGVNEDQVQARFEHGVLEVTVPLPEQRSRGRRVQIQAPGAGQSAGQRQSGGQQAGSAAGERHQGATGREEGGQRTQR